MVFDKVVALPVQAVRTPDDGVHKAVAGDVGSDMGHVSQGVGANGVAAGSVSILPEIARKLPGGPIVQHVGPQERLIIEALVEAKGKTFPPVVQPGDKDFQAIDEDVFQLSRNCPDCFRKSARQTAHFFGDVLVDGAEVLFPLRNEWINVCVELFKKVKNRREDAGDIDGLACHGRVAEIGEKVKQVGPDCPQAGEVWMIQHQLAQLLGVSTCPRRD